MKRFLALLLSLLLLLTGTAAIASAEEGPSGEEIVRIDGDYYVRDSATGKTAVFTGWYQATRKWTYGSGKTDIKSYWVYSEGKGKLVQGWKQIDGVWYYFTPEMVTDSWYDEGIDTLYTFEKNGAWTGFSTRASGWVKDGKKWRYVYKYTEVWKDGSYRWAYCYSNGCYQIDGKHYIFKDCVMQDNGWVDLKGESSDGTSYTSWYYVNPNGEVTTGWRKLDGKWYYFSDSGRMYDDGIYWIGKGENKKGYAFEKSGAMKENQWHSENWEGDLTYWFFMGVDGAAKTGWFKVGNDWYYADEYGCMYSDWLIEDSGVYYYLTKSGAMATGWRQIEGGNWFYFKNSGAMAVNEWVLDGSTWYYMGEDGAMYAGGTYNIGGVDYTFAANGAWVGK